MNASRGDAVDVPLTTELPLLVRRPAIVPMQTEPTHGTETTCNVRLTRILTLVLVALVKTLERVRLLADGIEASRLLWVQLLVGFVESSDSSTTWCNMQQHGFMRTGPKTWNIAGRGRVESDVAICRPGQACNMAGIRRIRRRGSQMGWKQLYRR